MGIILAAGQGKRMKSRLYKVLHPVCGKPMVGHVTDLLENIQATRIAAVVGHGAEAVQACLGSRAEYVLQEEQLGTGHAVKQVKDRFGGLEGVTIVVCGDTPLIRPDTLNAMIKLHQEEGAAATLLTAMLDNPQGYGRILRREDGLIWRVVEQKDCSEEEASVREINAGTYCFDNRKLFEALELVNNANAQGEYYLTDVIGILRSQGERISGYCTPDASESIGVNDRIALAEAERVMRDRIIRGHMLGGVTVTDPASTYVDAGVRIGPDTVLLPGARLTGDTVIGEDCVIGPNTDITDCRIGDGVEIRHSVLTEAEVGDRCAIGPFAYLRPGAKLGEEVKIGDFVEIKNASIGANSKVSHLAYIGDARVGRNVNYGCGAITVNYDGFAKNVTEIADDAFIGSNANLIAPVAIGQGAYVVAGSTITHDVGENDLAIARERQTNKPGYADIIRDRMKRRQENSDGSRG